MLHAILISTIIGSPGTIPDDKYIQFRGVALVSDVRDPDEYYLILKPAGADWEDHLKWTAPVSSGFESLQFGMVAYTGALCSDVELFVGPESESKPRVAAAKQFDSYLKAEAEEARSIQNGFGLHGIY